jgi:hypothetical protein
VTERFDGLAQQTIYGASGAGPAEPVTTLTSVGVGQGSGQTATKQEANSMIAFEFPIRWDDISGSLAELTDKKKLDQLVDDLTLRDNILEDYLNTNIVSGIVAGSNVSIDRATGVVTISAAAPAWTTFTPTITDGSNTATITNNNSAYARIGSIVHARINCTATFGVSTSPQRCTGMPVNIKPAANLTFDRYGIGSGWAGAASVIMVASQTTSSDRIDFTYPNGSGGTLTAWDIGVTVTYEAA